MAFPFSTCMVCLSLRSLGYLSTPKFGDVKTPLVLFFSSDGLEPPSKSHVEDNVTSNLLTRPFQPPSLSSNTLVRVEKDMNGLCDAG